MPSYNSNVITEAIRSALDAAPRGAKSRLAAAVGVRPQTVSKWINGETVPEESSWSAIEVGLGFMPGHLARLAAIPTSPDRLEELRHQIAQEVAADMRRDVDAQIATLREAIESMASDLQILTEHLRRRPPP